MSDFLSKFAYSLLKIIMRLTKIIYILALLVPFIARSQSIPRDSTVAQLKEQLAITTDPDDSIKILYNLYDIADRTNIGEYATRIFETAGRLRDSNVQLDVLRNVATVYLNNDSIINLCLEATRDMPESYDRKETELYLKVLLTASEVRKASQKEMNDSLIAIMERFHDEPDLDLYERIYKLYRLALYLGNSQFGDMYQERMAQLYTLISNLPEIDNSALSSLFYTQAAHIFTAKEEHEMAVTADKQLLEIMDTLAVRYNEDGRPYRNYDRNRYVSYRRLLGNYPALAPEEVEDYYAEICSIAARNSTVRKDLESNQRARIFYLMATRRFAEAMPLIRKHLSDKTNDRYRRQFLRFLKTCARATGDNATLLWATTEYNNILEEYYRVQTNEKYHEIDMLRDMRENQAERFREEIAALQDSNTKLKRYLRLCQGIVALLIVCLGAGGILMYRSAHRRNKG